MKHERIGSLDHEYGHDAYYLLTLDEDEQQHSIPRALAHDKFLELVYSPGRGPGTAFCTSVLVLPKSDTEFIGIAQVRYDV